MAYQTCVQWTKPHVCTDTRTDATTFAQHVPWTGSLTNLHAVALATTNQGWMPGSPVLSYLWAFVVAVAQEENLLVVGCLIPILLLFQALLKSLHELNGA